jgi:hypothetical protein
MKNFFNDLLGQLFTMLGFFIAWVTIDGSAKSAVAYATVWCLGIWILTYPLRRNKDEE